MIITDYDRTAAITYAREWALKRNPKYYDFGGIGGDCTNYASQCLYAGSGVMNYTPTFGWYYISADNRTASWTGVEYFYDFLVSSGGVGPFAREVKLDEAQPGDFIQFGHATNDFYHTPIITAIARGHILVCAHSNDALDRPLDTYSFDRYRVLHIEGVRKNE